MRVVGGLRLVGCWVVLLGASGACGSSGGSDGCGSGGACTTVRGLLIRVGGPAGTPLTRLPGTITVHQGVSTSGSVVAKAKAGSDGTFRVQLDYGTYTVVGSSPQVRGAGLCRADRPVQVTRARVTAQPPRPYSIVVTCSIR